MDITVAREATDRTIRRVKMLRSFSIFRQSACYRYGALICLLLVFSIVEIDASSAQSSHASSVESGRGGDQNIDALITAGDQLSVVVFDTPELSGPMRVRNDGTIDLPLLGSISVNGLNLSSAAKLIQDRLISGDYMKDPQVTVSFLDYSNHFATVLGEVARPGPIPLIGIRNVWDIVGAAGGVTPTAGSRVLIFHGDNSLNGEIYNINWSHDLQGQANPIVNPGDIVQILRAGVVYVVGEVNQQGGYPITHENLTLAQAVALAGGIKYTSKASKSQWIHTVGSKKVVTEIDVPRILKGKSADIALKDDDVIYVPNSESKVAILRGLQAAVSITSALVIYSGR